MPRPQRSNPFRSLPRRTWKHIGVTVVLFAGLVGYMWFTAGAMFRSAVTPGDVASGVTVLTLLSLGLFAFCAIALYENARAVQRDMAAFAREAAQEPVA